MNAMIKTSGLCRVLSAPRGPTDKISCRTPCGVPAPRMPVTPAVAGRVPELVRSEKIKRFLIVTIFVGRRMRGSRPRFGQSSDLTSDCRSDQLVKAGRRPYFASRRYSVDRAIPRRRAACVRFPSQSRTWARIAWRSASRRSPATGGGCSSLLRSEPGVGVRTSSGRSSASIRPASTSATVVSTTLRSSRTLPAIDRPSSGRRHL